MSDDVTKTDTEARAVRFAIHKGREAEALRRRCANQRRELRRLNRQLETERTSIAVRKSRAELAVIAALDATLRLAIEERQETQRLVRAAIEALAPKT